MKSNKILVIFFSLIFVFTSCSDIFKRNVEPVSEISIFPMMEFTEGYAIIWDLGKQWVEPGFNCSEVQMGDNDINESVVVDNSELNVNSVGYYFISYTATNKYNYKTTFYRTVVVKDPSASNYNISGNYYKGFGDLAAYMDIKRENENSNFYYATNIHTKNDVLSSFLLNMGNKEYCIPRIWVEYAGGQYMDGKATVNGNNITFDITFTSIEGNEFDANTTWTFNN